VEPLKGSKQLLGVLHLKANTVVDKKIVLSGKAPISIFCRMAIAAKPNSVVNGC